MENLTADATELRGVIERAQVGLVDRASLVETLVLSAVAGEHVLIVGPPGTAKSEAVRRVAHELGGDYFEYLLGRFTEPNEVFGPVDLARLREGVVETQTAGMLPEAEIAFLDEVFLGSTAILNTLLGILNERVFRRGATVRECPVRLCVGATNALPDDVSLAAFADRFLVRIYVDPVRDADLEALLEGGWQTRRAEPQPIGLAGLDRLAEARRRCDLGAVQPTLATAIRRIRAEGVGLSDRRAVRAQALVAAAATLAGRSAASDADLWPLPLVVPDRDAQPVARAALADLLEASESELLPAAAEELSAGPLARARRIADDAASLVAELGDEPDRDGRLRIEAILREIDAAFAVDQLPEPLAEVRPRLVDLVRT